MTPIPEDAQEFSCQCEGEFESFDELANHDCPAEADGQGNVDGDGDGEEDDGVPAIATDGGVSFADPEHRAKALDARWEKRRERILEKHGFDPATGELKEARDE